MIIHQNLTISHFLCLIIFSSVKYKNHFVTLLKERVKFSHGKYNRNNKRKVETNSVDKQIDEYLQRERRGLLKKKSMTGFLFINFQNGPQSRLVMQ